MRPTLLNHRSPGERTAEFRVTNVSKEGRNFDYIKKTFNQGGRNSTFN